MPRKEHNYHFIYKTTNLVNEKFYIGLHSTHKLEDGYLGSGTMLWHAIKKYGKENFKRETLEFLPDRDSLKAREKEIVNHEFLQNPMCMNISLGGQGEWKQPDPETRIKIQKLGGQGFSQKLKDPEYRQKVSTRCTESNKSTPRGFMATDNQCDWTGRKHRPEAIEQMRLSKKGHGIGETNSQFGTVWVKNSSETKKIKKTDLEQFIADGWTRGR